MSELFRQAGEYSDNPEALHPDSFAQDAAVTGAKAKTFVMGELSHMEGDNDTPEIGQKQPAAGMHNQQPEKGTGRPESSGPGQSSRDVQTGMARPEQPAIKNDLKAALLELKQFIAERGEDGNHSAKVTAAASQGIQDAAPVRNIQATIEGLLKDIETFQALSKATDSFYTFLPLSWKELRDGEISFKRGQGSADGRSSYSCRINLDLKEFGNLSVMVVMHNRDFFVSFKAEKPEFKSMLNANLNELKSAFIEKGLSLKAVNTLDKDDASFEHLEKLESSERIINIKA
jgi:flagellar hook-length control protein FliK